jgi:hypothetical protein
MHRIDTSGNVLNRFSEGNPAAGQLATRLSAAWFNDVQENIAEVIEYAGIALVKGTETQLRDAIVALIAGVVGSGGGSVPTTRQVNGAGLATGGGPLAADLVLTVLKASSADVAGGLLDDRRSRRSGLAAAMASVKAATGYTKLFNGFMLQWGVGTALCQTRRR